MIKFGYQPRKIEIKNITKNIEHNIADRTDHIADGTTIPWLVVRIYQNHDHVVEVIVPFIYIYCTCLETDNMI